jgi:hypothetical protein
MANNTSGSTSAPHIKQIIGCAGGVSWARRDEINPSDLTTHQTIYVNLVSGATQATAPAGFVASPCEVRSDAEFTVYCDAATTPPTPYIKRIVVDFSTTPPTQTVQNFTQTGAAYTPTTESTCDGYDLTEQCVEVFNTTNGVITTARSLQLTRYGLPIGSPVIYNMASNAVITPAATDTVVACGSVNYTESLLCDSSTPQVSFWRTQYKLGATVLYTQDLNLQKNAPYTPVGTVGLCSTFTVDDEYACIAGATPSDGTVQIRIRTVFNGQTVVSETRTRLDTYAVVANSVPLVPCTEAEETINWGSSLHVGTVTATIPVGRRSVTLTVRSGSVTATGSQHSGTAGVFEAGESYTWSRVNSGEILAGTVNFTGTTAQTRFKVTWTV